MIIDLKEMAKKGRTEENFFFEYSPEEELVSIPNVKLELPVKVLGTIRRVDKNTAFVEGEICFALSGECTRCLEPARREYAAKFAEEFSSAGAEDDYPFFADKIDLTKAVNDRLLFEMPIAFVCGEDCKGIELPESEYDKRGV